LGSGRPHLLAAAGGKKAVFRGCAHPLECTGAVALAVVILLALAAAVEAGFAA
jgi:hypothetical protein